MAALITKGTAIENSAFVLLARVIDLGGNPIVAADVDTITLKCFTAAGEIVTPAGAADPYTGTDLDPAEVVDDSPGFDPRWDDDDEPRNLVIPLDGSYLPEAGKYQIEVRVQPSAAGAAAFYLLWSITATNIFSE